MFNHYYVLTIVCSNIWEQQMIIMIFHKLFIHFIFFEKETQIQTQTKFELNKISFKTFQQFIWKTKEESFSILVTLINSSQRGEEKWATKDFLFRKQQKQLFVCFGLPISVRLFLFLSFCIFLSVLSVFVCSCLLLLFLSVSLYFFLFVSFCLFLSIPVCFFLAQT